MTPKYYTVGGYPSMRIEIDYRDGAVIVYKRHLHPDTAIELAKSVWKNHPHQPLKSVRVVNEKTGMTRDTISRVPKETTP